MSTNCEIERKFLVTQPLRIILNQHPNFRQMKIEQRYLKKTGDWTMRIRKVFMGDQISYWLTLKKKITNVSCVELETEISSSFYLEACNECGPPLEKIRYEVYQENSVWEVDVFTHPIFNGLVVAEIELSHEDQLFEKPDWLGEEVTHDRRYKNAKMIRHLSGSSEGFTAHL